MMSLLALAVGLCPAQDIDLRTGAAAVKPVSTPEELLDFTPPERADLLAAPDGDEGVDSPALYMLLRRSLMAADESVALDVAAPAALEAVAASPGVFRGRIVLLHLEIHRVSRHTPDTEAAAKWWGRRDCWRLDCLDRRSGAPLVLMLAELPPWLDARDYVDPIRSSVAAFYLNQISLPTVQSGQRADYPLFVARTLYGRSVQRSSVGRIVFFLLLGGLAGWWFIMKRRQGTSRITERAGAAQRPPTGEYDEAPVNEQLVEEIRRYQREQAAEAQESKQDHA